MLWVIIGLSIWLAGVVYGFAERWYRYTYDRGRWNIRNHGLIAFTDTQMHWLIIFWPLSWTVGISFIILLWVSKLINLIVEKITTR